MLERLKSTLYWQNFAGYVDKTDEYGNILGTVPEYGETQMARVNISAAKGAAEQEMFGALVAYDRTIAFKHTLDINENSIVWLDGAKPPQPYNYIVKRKSVSNNYTVLALQRVELSEE